MPPSNRNAGKWLVVGIVLCAFLLADYFSPRYIDDHGPVLAAGILLGVCIAQLNLIATWAALAPGNFVVRLPWSLLLTVFMWYSLVWGGRAAFARYSLDGAVRLGIVLLGGLIAAQIPLWIAKKLFGWRLASWGGDVDEASQGRLQFNLGHLLLGMLFVSLALGPARVVLPPGEMTNRVFHYEVFVLSLAFIACNLLVAVPCIWGAFLKRRILVPLAFAWPVYCLILTAIEFAVLVALLGPAGGKTALIGYLANVSQCAAVFGTLLVFRALGFRLLRVPSRRRGRRKKEGQDSRVVGQSRGVPPVGQDQQDQPDDSVMPRPLS